MKRTALIRHLTAHGCRLLREGARHSVWLNPNNGQTAAVPRHAELKNQMARKVCRDSAFSPQPG